MHKKPHIDPGRHQWLMGDILGLLHGSTVGKETESETESHMA